ncbi:Fic family protein [Dyadobacter fanqingshengii]|uniref:Fic family protein n=1 Tax=Dyadobacter fanqingshengii TaxID=2906443 RepID=A0A9X1TCZ7_9BACT|nr:Fic family protein [Dyadobacter fanqingshengii]MCF0043639.1 Fic family protein [Dyadobacter fanqingshengii]USJ34745.1 Fic family protein [Dyadobacter fanqingshengii]
MKSQGLTRLTVNFQEMATPEPGYLAGYAAIISGYNLKVPIPEVLAIISLKHVRYETKHWRVLTTRHTPPDTLLGHLTFAMKYEGIELGVLKALFQTVPAADITREVLKEPNGQYSRKIWFLYEWLMDHKLEIPDLTISNYVDLVDDTLQFPTSNAENSKRHRIRNNLPGVRDFCPMLRRTTLLTRFIGLDLSKMAKGIVSKTNPTVKARLATLLPFQEAKASYDIEKGVEQSTRADRWARVLRHSGEFSISNQELLRLQEKLIENPRFIKLGFREKEGFVGEQDIRHGTLLLTHLPAKAQDIDLLMNGLIETARRLEGDEAFDAVLATAIVSFGFVFIHPFSDGNGRIHRYLLHNLLSRKGFVPKGITFPISATILDKALEYQEILQHFSYPRISIIDWKPTSNHHFNIDSETIDLYRYFDATSYAEFLYGCVDETLNVKFPKEVDYLDKYDRMKQFLDDYFEMPDQLVGTLIRLLDQGQGKLGGHANKTDLGKLTKEEVQTIELKYAEIFGD